MEATSLDSLIQAKKTFDAPAAHMPDDQCKTAVIKAFELCYELADRKDNQACE